MDSLPKDILLLLPQWLPYTSVFRLQCISRPFKRVFTPPERVRVLVECWDYHDGETVKSHITIFLGSLQLISSCSMLPHPSMAAHVFTHGDWRSNYFCWWTELKLSALLPALKGEQYLTAGMWLTDSPTEILIDEVNAGHYDFCITISREGNSEFGNTKLQCLTGSWHLSHSAAKSKCQPTEILQTYIDSEIDEGFVRLLVKGVTTTVPEEGTYLVTSVEAVKGVGAEVVSIHIDKDTTLDYSPCEGQLLYITLDLDEKQTKALKSLGPSYPKNKAILDRIARLSASKTV